MDFRTIWAMGDYDRFARATVWELGPVLVEACGITAGHRVLDVAAGTGNVAIRAAMKGASVVACDVTPEHFAAGRRGASAAGVEVEWTEGDAEALPFEAASFDVVVSTFGVMFTPNQELAAAELVRVLKAGGKIGLANWTPAGFIGQMFKIIGRYLPPPAGAKSPALWGTRGRLDELFGQAGDIAAQSRHFVFRYRSPDHFLDVFKSYYGPMLKAFAALDAKAQEGLKRDLVALIATMNRARDGSMVVPSEYLEIEIIKH